MQHAMEMFHKAMPSLRKPTAEDGPAIWELIQACKPLDENSMYCNLIQCDHFSDTCIVGELDGEIVGWVSGYVLPDDPQTFFVWQVAVSEAARGTGLGTLMLQGLLERDNCADVTRLQTTITRDNAASWALFRKFSDAADGELSSEPYFSKSEHFNDMHDTEHMVTITMMERAKTAA
ncbi:diaminobutyrate acetyltransferase [Roseovarius tibetensis]|uniref:diaminobutyrate acetyltransferase n=1 Tax=Roseovarius tibetensis TaxID=2685897 RepID=UPI003D7FE79E